MKKGNIRIKAGKIAGKLIREGGFSLEAVSACYGPAAGPRWLIAAGFDLALIRSGLLGKNRAVTLAGSSAGAFRFASFIQPEPEKAYRNLLERYIELDYTQNDTPQTLLAATADLMDQFLEEDAISFALANKRFRLAVITCRGKNLLGIRGAVLPRIGLGLAYLANLFSRERLYRFAERVVFYQGSLPPVFCLKPGFRGLAIPLSEANFKAALLASGAIPLVISPIEDIYGAPRGLYLDGGLLDYHLTHDLAGPDGITLFFHHQERIIPGWLDQRLPRRQTQGEILDRVVMVFPQEELIARLPGKKVPDRTDFVTFINDGAKRKRLWREAVQMTSSLGEEFLDLLEKGRLGEIVEPFETD
jgi:hypothetical protein